VIKHIQHYDWRFYQLLTRRKLPVGWLKISKMFVRIGDGWFWLPVVLAILLNKRWDEFYSITGQCIAVLAISLAFYWPVKLSVRRLRPFHCSPGLAAEVPPLDRFSFPSGHTMHNLAIGLTLAHSFPLAFWPLTLIPFAWGFFRIYFGVHFLSDILAGGLLGSCCFQIGKWLFV
jgi:undecaprenyl-diphosphatase